MMNDFWLEAVNLPLSREHGQHVYAAHAVSPLSYRHSFPCAKPVDCSSRGLPFYQEWLTSYQGSNLGQSQPIMLPLVSIAYGEVNE